MTEPGERLSVLHVILKIQATNGQYNEHCLPFLDGRLEPRHDLTVCSFLPPDLDVHQGLRLFSGDGTFRGGVRAMSEALATDPDVIHVHAPQTGAMVLALSVLRRRGLANAVYTIQNSYANYRFRNRLLMIPIFAAYPRLVFCSRSALKSMNRPLRWLARNKSTIIDNAVDVDSVTQAIAGHDKHPGDGFHIVSVGRLVDIKAPLEIVRAVAALGDVDVELTFVGDGPLRKAIDDEARQLGLEGRVHVTGMVPRPSVYRHVASADLFVSASYGEGLPVAVLESMLCGPPGILTRIPPHEELVEGLDDAVLVDTGDTVGLTAAIRAAMEASPEERRHRAAAARQLVIGRYGLEAMHEAYHPVYAAAASRTPSGTEDDLPRSVAGS